MADLPSVHFSAKPAVFKNVGIDYCGPFQILGGKQPIQRYICLITCLVVRAVHLEPVTDLSTEKCLMAIDRFLQPERKPRSHIQQLWNEFFREQLTYFKTLHQKCQVVGILNSRPLSPVSSDCNDLEALSPSHFLIGHVLPPRSTLELAAVSSKQTKRM